MAGRTIGVEFVNKWVQEVHCAPSHIPVAAEANPEEACEQVATAWSKQKATMLPGGCVEGSRESSVVKTVLRT